MACYMGIDIGSGYSKGVVMKDGELAAFQMVLSGADYRATAQALRRELLARAKLAQDEVAAAAATGIGAGNVDFASKWASDIVCTARGIHDIFPSARAVIDLGAQSSRVIQVDWNGRVANFAVTEKCAAGGGQFVEVIANVLRIALEDFGALSLRSEEPVMFNTGCAVFGESEAVTRVAEGARKEDIAAGVNKALADKITSLTKRIEFNGPCAVCGGGALNAGLVKCLEDELRTTLLVPPRPQIVAAWGAALMATLMQCGDQQPRCIS
ncbi:MAG: acyl-CoA dehydratase activase [Chloroflexota bacterium]|nr:acyl-CoA dehydratase activase [Chloroflexota bacterium]